MRKTTLLILSICLILTGKLSAQVDSTSNKIKEIGLGITDFNSFQLMYQWGDNERLFRFTGGYGINKNSRNTDFSYNNTNTSQSYHDGSDISKEFNQNLEFTISRIKFKGATQKVQLIYGPTLSIGYNSGKTETNSDRLSSTDTEYMQFSNIQSSSRSITPALGAIIGGRYSFNKNFSLYLDFSPKIYCIWFKSNSGNETIRTDPSLNDTFNTSTSSYFNYGLNILNSTARVSLFLSLTK